MMCRQALTRSVAARHSELVVACMWRSRLCSLYACDVFSAGHLASPACFTWFLFNACYRSVCYEIAAQSVSSTW